jgi:hypothetical protein
MVIGEFVEKSKAMMLKLGDMFIRELSEKAELGMPKQPLHTVRIMSATLLVCGVMLMTAWTQAKAEVPEAAQVTSIIDSSDEMDVAKEKPEKKAQVSPYVKASRQHVQVDEPNEVHKRSLAITVGFPGVPSGQGKRH